MDDLENKLKQCYGYLVSIERNGKSYFGKLVSVGYDNGKLILVCTNDLIIRIDFQYDKIEVETKSTIGGFPLKQPYISDIGETILFKV